MFVKDKIALLISLLVLNTKPDCQPMKPIATSKQVFLSLLSMNVLFLKDAKIFGLMNNCLLLKVTIPTLHKFFKFAVISASLTKLAMVSISK